MCNVLLSNDKCADINIALYMADCFGVRLNSGDDGMVPGPCQWWSHQPCSYCSLPGYQKNQHRPRCGLHLVSDAGRCSWSCVARRSVTVTVLCNDQLNYMVVFGARDIMYNICITEYAG